MCAHVYRMDDTSTPIARPHNKVCCTTPLTWTHYVWSTWCLRELHLFLIILYRYIHTKSPKLPSSIRCEIKIRTWTYHEIQELSSFSSFSMFYEWPFCFEKITTYIFSLKTYYIISSNSTRISIWLSQQ